MGLCKSMHAFPGIFFFSFELNVNSLVSNSTEIEGGFNFMLIYELLFIYLGCENELVVHVIYYT